MNRKITKIIAIIAVVAMLASFLAINVTADETTIAASGYAAIGIVDAGANKAEVLLGTGEQGTVTFTGDAPVTGGVYRYTRDENNAYTFVAPEANMGNSDQLTGGSYWYSFTSVNGYMWNYNGVENLFFWSVNSPVFLRASKTEWMLGTNACFVEGTMVASYYLDITANESGHPHYNVSAFVFGGLEADGTVNISGFDTLKLPEAKYDLGAFTTPLHPVAEPEVTEPEATEPEVPTVDAPVDPSKLTSYIGKYTDGAGADESTFVASGNGEALTDGDPDTIGKADFTYADSEADGSLAAIIIDIDGTIKLTGIEIDPYDFINQWGNLEGAGDISTFTIQALVDGAWVDLVSEEGFLFGDARYAKFDFDAVETNKVRILIPFYWDNLLQVGEIILIEEKPVEETPEDPTEPEATEPEVTEPEATEPEATEPEATEPEATEPEATEPEATEPEATEPEATEPEATEPEATEPEATEPESNGYTASGNVVETGYAAIGAVDEELSKAQVLLGNGKTGTVYFAGTAPKTGVVYGYELHSNNVFVFVEKDANFGHSNQSDYNTAWYMWFTPNGWAWDANSPTDVFHAPYPIFVNYGDNQWVLTTIDKVAETNGGAAAFGYVLDPVRDMPDYDAGNGMANHHAGALVIDGVKEDQYAKPAQLFGAAGEKVGLGSFTTDLYTPTTSGNTGDGPSKTGDVVISVLCGMFAISVIGGAVIISKKKEF